MSWIKELWFWLLQSNFKVQVLTHCASELPTVQLYHKIGKSKTDSYWLLWFNGCWLVTWGVPQLKFKSGSDTWKTRREWRKGPTTSHWWVAVSIGKRTCIGWLSWPQTSRSHHLPGRILKVYKEASTGFIPIVSPDDLGNTMLSLGCILAIASGVGNSGQNVHPKDRVRVKSLLQWPRFSSRATWSSCVLHDLLQQKASTDCFHSLCLCY